MSPSRRLTGRAQRLAPYAAPTAVLLVVAFACRDVLANPFFGSDTWPWLLSTRLSSPGDVLRVAFSPIMSGTRFVDEVALFYHPVTALSYSLDQVLFGLHPAGFYATNVLLHLVAVTALYTLARGLGTSRWAASVCALVLGLHPISVAAVPSLPRRQDLVVGASLLTSMSLLTRVGLDEARPRWTRLAGSMVAYSLALGSKEIAYAALALVPFVLHANRVRSPGLTTPRAVFLRRSAGVMLGFVLLEALVFAIRWRVLGGLGGYYGTESVRGNFDGLLEYFIRPYVTSTLWPFASVLPIRLRDWLLCIGLLGVIVAVGLSCLKRRTLLIALLGVCWQAAFVALYAVVHTSLSPYLLYVPLAGLALLAGALTDGAIDWLTQRAQRTRWKTVGAAASAVSVTLLLLGVLQTSALVHGYAEFRDAGAVSSKFLDQALPCVASAPPGSVVWLEGLPHRIDYGSAESQFVDAFVFEPYSVESIVRLLAPGTQAAVEVRSSQEVRARPTAISVSCTQQGNTWHITTRLSP